MMVIRHLLPAAERLTRGSPEHTLDTEPPPSGRHWQLTPPQTFTNSHSSKKENCAISILIPLLTTAISEFGKSFKPASFNPKHNSIVRPGVSQMQRNQGMFDVHSSCRLSPDLNIVPVGVEELMESLAVTLKIM